MSTSIGICPRTQALDLLQSLDPEGAYTDAASAVDKRRPCQLWEAIRSVSALIETTTAEKDQPAELLELLRLLSDWAAADTAIAHIRGARQ